MTVSNTHLTSGRRKSFVIYGLLFTAVLVLAPGVIRYIQRYHEMEQLLAQQQSDTVLSVLPQTKRLEAASTLASDQTGSLLKENQVHQSLGHETDPSKSESDSEASSLNSKSEQVESPAPLSQPPKAFSNTQSKVVATPQNDVALLPMPALTSKQAESIDPHSSQSAQNHQATSERAHDASASVLTPQSEDATVQSSSQGAEAHSMDGAELDVAPKLEAPFTDPQETPQLPSNQPHSRSDASINVTTAGSKQSEPQMSSHRTQSAHATPTIQRHAKQTIQFHATQSSRYVVQVASFTQVKAAQRLVNRLKADGYQAQVIHHTTPKGHSVAQVVLNTSAKDKASAQQLNTQLFKQYQINGYVRRLS
ncbi:MAG: hypothetical protein CMF51_01585 [Legionellales bacterium]|nr:hypothetical protein [Legionellales bacterium]